MSINRRELLKMLAASPVLINLPGTINASQLPQFNPNRKLSMRFAHITDIHLLPERDAPLKFVKCLHHINKLPEKLDFIFCGGDLIMDALVQERDRVQEQWDLWHSIMRNECNLKLEYCIGNHDIWGLEKAKDDPMYAKKYATEMMELAHPYRSFNLKGWHIIVLDSTHLDQNGKWYVAKLDEEQMAWLKNDLKETSPETPVLIVSHIPIFAACVFNFGDNVKNERWDVPGSWMHIDAVELIRLFHEHQNVKACISGHMHLLDLVVYNNVQYFCNGAVSGSWWKNEYYHQTRAGYAIMSLYDDGTVERVYHHYT
jgi:3',5'-cyclic AMP phosphodiesterase CpdA